jgi:pimeloyl-ACP methyl ester carboxylesterase
MEISIYHSLILPKHTMGNLVNKVEAKGYNLTIEVNNFTLSYDDVGEGDVPVIFLHGFPFDKSMWHVQLDVLKTSHRLIACDIRGFGKSTDESTALSIDLFADDLIQFMDMLSIEKAIICGLSMGGYVAQNVLKRYPDRFEALILCDTQCIADTTKVKEARLKTIDEIQVEGVTNFNEGFLKKVFCKDSLKNKKKLVEQLRTVVFANTPHIISQGLVVLAGRLETCSILPAIAIPTLIICGRQDEVTPLAQSEFMHKNIKGSLLHIIDNAGHVSNLEQPDTFNNCLIDFLDNVSGKEVEYFSWDEKGTHNITV